MLQAKEMKKIEGPAPCRFPVKSLDEKDSVRLAMQYSHGDAKKGSDHRNEVMDLGKSHKQLRNLASHLQYAREEEKKDIAREIHDKLGQSLTVLKMDLSMMEKRLTTNERVETLSKLVKADLDLVNAAIHTVKRLSTELRPSILDHLGIGAAVEWQAEKFEEKTSIKCEVNLVPADISVDAEYSTALFRIFQELLTNVLRHAKATKVAVKLSDQGSSIILEITDNGVGIAKKHLSKTNSFGLFDICERVQICNGEMRIIGRKKTGTTITVTIPKR